MILRCIVEVTVLWTAGTRKCGATWTDCAGSNLCEVKHKRQWVDNIKKWSGEKYRQVNTHNRIFTSCCQRGSSNYVDRHLHNASLITACILCLRKTRHPFYFCDNILKRCPILISFGCNIPEGICSIPVIIYRLKTSCVFVSRGPA